MKRTITMNPRPMSMVCSEDKAATLGADDYKEPQIICLMDQGVGVMKAYGFDGKQGSKAGTIGFQEDVSGTLEAGKVKHVLCLMDQGGERNEYK